jgi:hypothetical protein
MQADSGFAGARSSLYADRLVQVRADHVVLLRLDRRDDVPHRPYPRTLDLLGEYSAPDSTLGRVDEVLVLV